MLPQLGIGGWMPRPTEPSVGSRRVREGTWEAASRLDPASTGPAEAAPAQPDREPGHARQHDAEQAHDQGDPRPVNEAAQRVPAELVGSKRVLLLPTGPERRPELVREILVVV